MDRTELITNALLDRYGSGINIYTSSDILIAAGISEQESLDLLEELKKSVVSRYEKNCQLLVSTKIR